MKYVYASRMGKTEKLIGKLALDAMKIENGTETAEGDYILFTYTEMCIRDRKEAAVVMVYKVRL